MNSVNPPRQFLPPFVLTGMILTLLAVVTIGLAGLGSRWGWWNFRTGLGMLRWGTVAVGAALLITIVASLFTRGTERRRSLVAATVITAMGIAVASVPVLMARVARAVPPIHDITTDFENPPSFLALREKRTGALNSIDYGGPAVASLQRASYPDIGPLVLPLPPARVMENAVGVARELGWAIVAVDTAAGQLEATARTRWFGFRDDVAVRVTPNASGSRVDVRSVSRVGKSDLGANARRIRTFLIRLHDSATSATSS